MELVVAITYHIWLARNVHTFHDKDIPDQKVIMNAYSRIQDFQTAKKVNQDDENLKTNSEGASKAWKKPVNARVKANSDANLAID
ncbi:hypothetical protein A2U01_0048093, partial [Trifolium medium]|nr:hypothetical protein [Trifolium medium]